MHISEDRISHLAHRIIDALWKGDLADLPDERRSLQCVKDAVARYFEVGDEIDTTVRAKLSARVMKGETDGAGNRGCVCGTEAANHHFRFVNSSW